MKKIMLSVAIMMSMMTVSMHPAVFAEETDVDLSSDVYDMSYDQTDDTSVDIDDISFGAVDIDTDEIFTDDQVYEAGDWYEWVSGTATFILKGQLPNTDNKNFVSKTNVNPRLVRKIRILPDTKAGSNLAYAFSELYNVTEIDGLNYLDTRNVTDMRCMFYKCENLTALDISGLNTSKVIYMDGMFDQCVQLSSIKLTGINTRNVQSMRSMFASCKALSSIDLTGIDTSNVTDMRLMFSYCQKLTSIDLSKMDTSNVTNMNSMFLNCQKLSSIDLSKMDTGKVTDMGYMFYGCSSLWSIDLSGLDLRNVSNMECMFRECRSLTSFDFTGCDTGNVKYMVSMFANCKGLTSADLSGMDMSNVTDMNKMFSNCTKLASIDLSGINANNIQDINGMFSNCSVLTSLDLSGLDLNNAVDVRKLFSSCFRIRSLILTEGTIITQEMSLQNSRNGYAWSFDGKLISTGDNEYIAEFTAQESGEYAYIPIWFDWDESTGTFTLNGPLSENGIYMEYSIPERAGVDPNAVKKIVITTDITAADCLAYAFYGLHNLTEIDGLSNLDTSNVTRLCGMFTSCQKLRSLDLSRFDTSKVIDMGGMFAGCSSLVSLDLSSFDTSKVNYMYEMFIGCSSLKTLDMSTFDLSSLQEGTSVFSFALEHFHGSNYYPSTDIGDNGYMFEGCDALTSLMLPEGFEVSSDMMLRNIASTGFGWVKKGTENIVSGAGKYAVFKADAAEYIFSGKGVLKTPAKPTVVVKTAFGGKAMTFNCADKDAEIYYNIGSSNITTSCKKVANGGTVFFDTAMAKPIYFKAYMYGKWSTVSKNGLNNVQIAKPLCVQSGAKSKNDFKVYTQTKDSYIVYTLDGSVPAINEGTQKLTVKNGRIVWGTTAVINIPKGRTIKAIAIRCGLVTSDVMTYTNK